MLSTLENKMNEYGSSQSEFLVSIPLHGKKVELDSITDLFLQYTALPESTERRIFHIDISNEVNTVIYRCMLILKKTNIFRGNTQHIRKR